MSLDAAPGLVGRVKRLIWDPPLAWDAIAREEPGGVLAKHAAPLALLMALCGFLGALMAADFTFDGETLIAQPIAAALRFVMALAGVALLARLIEMLAPRFGVAPAPGRAAQLSGYGATAFLIAGVGMLAPALAPYVLATGAIYSLALIYIGLPRPTGA
ncbi:MAG TPA: hypothetical protein PLS69_10440, partial [Terricaulis sp.]|nr:hypothetical protein [Terricaulis sp.]